MMNLQIKWRDCHDEEQTDQHTENDHLPIDGLEWVEPIVDRYAQIERMNGMVYIGYYQTDNVVKTTCDVLEMKLLPQGQQMHTRPPR